MDLIFPTPDREMTIGQYFECPLDRRCFPDIWNLSTHMVREHAGKPVKWNCFSRYVGNEEQHNCTGRGTYLRMGNHGHIVMPFECSCYELSQHEIVNLGVDN